MTFTGAITRTFLWVLVALLFNFGIYWLYPVDGKEAALLFFTGYLVEKSLSLDNIFVIALIFSYFRIPSHLHHHVLTWGIFGAIILRFLMILFGITLVQHFSFMNYIFGIFLLYTAVNLLTVKQENIHPENNLVVRLVKKLMPVTYQFHGTDFFVKINGIWTMTPLFLSLIVVETCDLLFAIDSIPAILSITTDPFLVFTSNIFAILGLRSLYFIVAAAMNKFRYLKLSLAFLLIFISVKMLTAHYYTISAELSLSIIVGILFTGVVASRFLSFDKTT